MIRLNLWIESVRQAWNASIRCPKGEHRWTWSFGVGMFRCIDCGKYERGE